MGTDADNRKILKIRLANGEISIKEYESILKILNEQQDSASEHAPHEPPQGAQKKAPNPDAKNTAEQNKYSYEFKIKAIWLVLEEKMSITAASQAVKISRSLMSQWVDTYKESWEYHKASLHAGFESQDEIQQPKRTRTSRAQSMMSPSTGNLGTKESLQHENQSVSSSTLSNSSDIRGRIFSEYLFSFILFVGRYVILISGIIYAAYIFLSSIKVSWKTGEYITTFDTKSIFFSIGIIIFAFILSQTVLSLNKKVYGEYIVEQISDLCELAFLTIWGIGVAIIGGWLGYEIGMALSSMIVVGIVCAVFGGFCGLCWGLGLTGSD